MSACPVRVGQVRSEHTYVLEGGTVCCWCGDSPDCPECDGEGHVEDPEGYHGELVSCDECKGSGRRRTP